MIRTTFHSYISYSQVVRKTWTVWLVMEVSYYVIRKRFYLPSSITDLMHRDYFLQMKDRLVDRIGGGGQFIKLELNLSTNR